MQVTGLAAVAGMAGGDEFSVAIKDDGSVWTWGADDPLVPAKVEGLSGVVSAASGPKYGPSGQLGPYNLAVRSDGSLWEWGLRFGETFPRGPSQVSGFSDVAAAVPASARNLVLTRDGTIWEWRTSDPKPSRISGLTDVVAIAAAACFWDGPPPDECPSLDLALKGDGTVWAWGANFHGQLGDGTDNRRAVPVQVTGLSDVAAVATRTFTGFMGGFAGDVHSVALKHDGTVWEWPIWEDLTAKSLVPVQVAGLSDIVAVAEGGGHSLELKRDGTVWAWGRNIYGQLGVRTIVIRTTPVQVVGPATQ